jgi:hypothetical protein
MALILAFMPLRSQAQDEPEVLRPAKFELIDFDPQSISNDGPTASAMLGFAALESKEDVLGEQGEVEKPEVKEYDSKPEVKEYDSLDEAQQDLNDHIAQPSWMPDSFSDQVAGVMIVEASSAEYTVDLAKVESVTQEVGIGPIVLPPETDGAVLMLDAPAKVILAYGADTESPDFVLAQMRMPTLTIPGEVNVEAVRLALLAAMPSDLQPLASQLESISDWKNTFPVLAPKDAGAVEVEVSGNQGVLIIPPDDDQKLLVWSQNDYLFGVFTRNSISSDDLVRLASSVR